MKTKILTALKTKYKNLGFGEKAFEGVADYLATTVTDEANIETAISGVEPMLKAFQSEADRLRGENTALKTQLEAAKKTEPKPDEPPKKMEGKNGDDDGDDTSKLLKSVLEKFDGLQKELETIKTDKVTGSRKSQLDDTLKDAPESLRKVITTNFSKMKFDSDDDFADYLTGVSTQVEEVAKELKIEGVSANSKSQKGSGDVGKKEATKEELDAAMDKLPK